MQSTKDAVHSFGAIGIFQSSTVSSIMKEIKNNSGSRVK